MAISNVPAEHNIYWSADVMRLIVFLSAMVTLLIALVGFSIYFAAVPTMPIFAAPVVVAVAVDPGRSQQVSAYMNRDDRMKLDWATDGAEIAYRIYVEDGHVANGTLAAGRSSEGSQHLVANHGGLYGAIFTNGSQKRVTVIVRAKGRFEFVRATNFPLSGEGEK
ncbi:hypothetical protein [Tardiphaga sp.]|uniref:hypothetical protein n=1 Tax=Tardiphaga sp. TaxID=1926292 RepID=UPI00352B7B9F